METSTINVIVLTPSEGKYLTRVNRSEEEQPIFSKKVFLGANDSADNWREAEEEEKISVESTWEAKERKRMNAELQGEMNPPIEKE